MEAVIEEFIKNRYGIKIKKCCASCIFHLPSKKEDRRVCEKTGEEHTLDYLCPSGTWEMMRPDGTDKPGVLNLDNAGRSGGSVKTPSYIRFVRDNGPRAEEYEKIYGSRFLTK